QMPAQLHVRHRVAENGDREDSEVRAAREAIRNRRAITSPAPSSFAVTLAFEVRRRSTRRAALRRAGRPGIAPSSAAGSRPKRSITVLVRPWSLVPCPWSVLWSQVAGLRTKDEGPDARSHAPETLRP